MSDFLRIESDFDKNLMRLLKENKIDIDTFRRISRYMSQLFCGLSSVDHGEAFLYFEGDKNED